MRILVVDDSAVMRRIVIGALAKAGLTDVNQAGDGHEAVAAVTTEDYDLVLMDWNMPNMKGIDAVREMRALGYRRAIMMVTTEAEKSRVLEAIKAGANNYVIKPFEPDTLITKVQETMARVAA
jgi:two-component system chemotaxis response regulator CheY